MNKEMHGKKIEQIRFPESMTEGSIDIDPYVCSSETSQLVLSVTYHGDHDEIWILEIREGREVARFNPRYVEMIVWAADESN
jgi:sugar lactone lactonase YvrE